MTEVLLLLAFIVFCSLAAWVYQIESHGRASTDCVRDELFQADQRIAGEFQSARRAMNDAAGQSWRNLAG